MKEDSTSKGDFICINCTSPVETLYQTYETISNTILLECSNCKEISDIYLSLTYSVLLLDLLLFKKRAYRHLLFNRGSSDKFERDKGRRESLIRVGVVVLLLDSYIRCANVGSPQNLKPFLVFGETLRYCFLETLSLHSCITLFALIFQFFTSSTNKSTPKNYDISRLSLTLLYTSLPTLFLLTISSLIFNAEYSTPHNPSSPASEVSPFFTPFLFLPFLPKFPIPNPDTSVLHPLVKGAYESIIGISRGSLKSSVSTFGNTRGWASESILRKGVGGSSTVVGVSVLLKFSKLKTCCLLGLAWCLHLVVLHAIDPWLL